MITLIALKDFYLYGDQPIKKDQVFKVCCISLEQRLKKLKQAIKYVEPIKSEDNTDSEPELD